MSVFYRLSQVTSPKAKGYGKWYPRAVITETIDTDKLAEIMQRNCTVKSASEDLYHWLQCAGGA